MAGLTTQHDAVLAAMARTEQILAWAHGRDAGDLKASLRLATFMQVFTLQLRAAEAMMPYGLAKVTPDTVQTVHATQIVMAAAPQAPAKGGDRARDVTPQAHRIGPPPMPHQMQRNQEVSAADPDGSDADARTREPSR
jgi:hypothetical protein